MVEEKKQNNMIQSLLDFKDQLDNIVEESFENSQDFINALNKTFENVLNSRENTYLLLLFIVLYYY